MFRFSVKNFWERQLKMALRYRLMSYKNENIIGGGLEKLQGGLKEEKYFSEKNSNLMAKLRDQGTKLNIGNFNSETLDTQNRRSALRDSCSINKHKNCLEEAFFLSEQNECCAKLCKEDSLKRLEIKEETKTDME